MPLPIMPLLTGAGAAMGAVNPLLSILGLPNIEALNVPGQWLRGALAGRPGDLLSGDEFIQSVGQGLRLLPEYEPMAGPAAPGGPGPFIGRPDKSGAIAPGRGTMQSGPFRATRDAPPPPMPNVVGGAMAVPPPEAPAPVPVGPQSFGLLGSLAEMLVDPFALMGGGLGALAGAKASRGIGNLAQRAVLGDQIADLSRLQNAANVGRGLTGTSDDALTLAMKGMSTTPAYAAAEAAQAMPFQANVLDELGPMFGRGGKFRGPATFNRIDDSAKQMMMNTGLGFPGDTPGSISTFLPQGASAPSYLRGRGGKMFLEDPAWAGLQPDDLLVGGGLYDQPQTLGALLGPGGAPKFDYMDLVTNQPADLMALPLDKAGGFADDLIGQRVGLLDELGRQQPGKLIQALYNLGFR